MPATTIATGADALARICADTRAETARRKAATPLEAIKARARAAGRTRGFGRALMDRAASGFALIAEIKKASPSGGMIRPDYDPAALARAYRDGGATCLSVLTDAPHFQGSADDLRAARAAVELPVLRKDFILDPWQVYESRAMGADCILLILAALTNDEARAFEEIADSLDMDVLVEVHEREELDRTACLQTRLIGVNNRNLKTLKTEISTSLELSVHVEADKFIIGESLMRQPDVAAATRALLLG